MSEEKYSDVELRTEALRIALRNRSKAERCDKTDDLITNAQSIFEFLKNGTTPKGGEEDGK